MTHITVLDRILAGEYPDEEALFDALDDAIEAWHTTPTNVKIHEWMGMTWEEYAAFVQTPYNIHEIVRRRKAP